MTILFFILGLGLLVVGAEILVKGASRLARSFGVSPLVIGLTVVAFGTSSPELAVSAKAAIAGQASIALGNVVGSNIFNVLMILGLSALIAPLVVSQKLVRFDVPLMIGLSLAVFLLALDGRFSRLEGVILLAGLLAYIAFLILESRFQPTDCSDEFSREYGKIQPDERGPIFNLVLIVGGLILLVFGSRWIVDSSEVFARRLGVSEFVIAVTVVAAGTSLPELVTSIIAGIRGERDIAVGNIVGSNIFNLTGVLGLAAALAPGGVAVADSVAHFDLPIMIVVAFSCLPIFFTGGVINRWEGGLFLGYYLAYTTYVILAAEAHDALPIFSNLMLGIIIPLTLVTIFVIALGQWRRARRSEKP